MKSDTPNPSGVNMVNTYGFKYDLATLGIQTDVLNGFDVDKPISVTWITYGK